MSHALTISHQLQPHSLAEHWEVFKAVRSLRALASRWASPADDSDAAVQIPALLSTAELGLDPVIDLLDRVIAGETPDAPLALGPLAPNAEAVVTIRSLLLAQARSRVSRLTRFAEKFQFPRCDDAEQFLAAFIHRYEDLLRRLGAQDADQASIFDDHKFHPEALAFAAGELSTWASRLVDYSLPEVPGPDSSEMLTSRQTLGKLAVRLQAIGDEGEALPDDGIQKSSYMVGRLEELLSHCRTIRGIQETLIRQVHEELVAMEERFASPPHATGQARR